MFWLPPVLFSTTTGCFHASCRYCASVRAMVSGEPPGGSGTMIFSARSGKPCASAANESTAASIPAIHRFTFPSSRSEGAVYLLARSGIAWSPAHFTRKRVMKRTLIASALLALAAPSWSQDAADPGKAIVDGTCNTCHPVGARVGSGYTPEGWDTVLRMMTNHGVAIAPDKLPLMRDYLAKTYPVKGRPDAVLVTGPVKVSMKAWQVATPGSRPHDPMAARDGSLWYTGQMANVLGRVDPKTGKVKEYPLKTAHSGPHGLKEDRQGNIWYTGNTGALVGKLNP